MKSFMCFLFLIVSNCCLLSCVSPDLKSKKKEPEELISIERLNEPTPGIVAAATCEDKNTKKTVKKLKYLGKKRRYLPMKYAPPDFCGDEKLLSYDYGFFACDYAADWVSPEGGRSSTSGKLRKDEHLFLNWDKVITTKFTALELMVMEYVDEDPLPFPPTDSLDDISIKKVKEIQHSNKSDYELCIGCPNDEAHRHRFKDVESFVFLDVMGYGKGHPFLHMSFDNETVLKLIALDGEYSLKGRFKSIAFDFSVARFGKNFGAQQIDLLMNLLRKDGVLYMWPDERPFEEGVDANVFSEDQWRTLVTSQVDIMRRRLNALKNDRPDFDLDDVDRSLSLFSQSYRRTRNWFRTAYPQKAQSMDPKIDALVDDFEKMRLELLILSFERVGIVLEEKRARYPLPGDEDRLKNVVYYTLKRR